MNNKRPPIIAIVGHIDHGKSKLQQALRKINFEVKEAGDITQHIGAYEINTEYEGKKRRATIIDTPGHEAFSHIRKHGLGLADLALLIVSSEEGWKEQTKEVYKIIEEEKIPFIVVFTKIDTEKSNIEKAKDSVLKENIFLEGLGGNTPWVAISSVTEEGISSLIELIFLTTDIYEIVEDRSDNSVGVLLEVDIDTKIGIAGTIIVLQDSLPQNKFVTVGNSVAPLRIMKNDRGQNVLDVVPSTPIKVFGFNSIPPIGESVFIHNTKKEALEFVKKNETKENNNIISSVGETDRSIILILILKSDTASGLVSIKKAIEDSAVSGISFKVIKEGIGNITEEDVRISLTEKDCFVVGFHTELDKQAKHLSERDSANVFVFSTIYEVTDWANSKSVKKKEKYELDNTTGEAKVIRIFDGQDSKSFYIVGAEIVEGTFVLGQDIVLTRKDLKIGRFTIKSIQQRNKDVETVSDKKTQFAMRIDGTGDVSIGDAVLGFPI